MKEKHTAIVLAAGSGKRMHSQVQKQYMDLFGKPVLYYALRQFEECEFIDEVILVTKKDEIAYCREKIVEVYHLQKVKDIIEGGEERYLSVYNALKAAGACDYIYIHDGARPFVDQEMLQRLKEAVCTYGACVAAVPSKDTLKLADEALFAKETLKRSEVWNIQTPQVFAYPDILGAYEKMMQEDHIKMGITDDAMVLEKMEGQKVKLVEGSYYNIKITTPEDLDIAEIFVKKCNLQEN